MKIGILTHPLLTNYGGILQNYALQSMLTRMGHDVYTIYIGQKVSKLNWLKEYTKYLIKILIGRNSRPPLTSKQQNYLLQHTRKFINQHINTTIPMSCVNKNILIDYHFDAFIVGSDQVWRPSLKRRVEEMFFDFLSDEKVKRIAYAASFGVDEWLYTSKQEKHCLNLIKKFHAISVREETGIDLCKTHFHVEAKHILDPAFLLNKYEYEKLISEEESKNESQLAIYILDISDIKKQIAEIAAKQLNLKILYIGNPKSQRNDFNYLERIVPPIEEWLGGIKNCQFVVTDSFHGVVFSIIFKKPFLCIGNKERGMARFLSLLKIFELEDRLIDPIDGTIDKINIGELVKNTIDFKRINSIILNERKKAFHFLTQVLEN